MKFASWLLLLYALPTKHTSERVSLWRKLKKLGAIQLKTSAYVLPDNPANYERFKWLAQQINDSGGNATLIRVSEIEGLPHDQVVALFNEARAAEYKELMDAVLNSIARRKKSKDKAEIEALERFQRWFNEIREIDCFDAPASHDAQMVLQRYEKLLVKRGQTLPAAKLDRKNFQGKTWLTRPRPEIDRVGSAWLIRKFIDPRAKFVFGSDPKQPTDAIPYDMFEVEFSHHGEDCTFETLLKRFGIEDKAVQKIAEMIHEADLEDGKFQRVECLGLDRVLKGWAKSGLSDPEILTRGADFFEALYQFLKK
jgi:hypothetical protein